ncbi:MAG: hypothetical protein KDK02_09925 [Rhodobacteraceae bacterium]|nr:hypothetical protein [Paracoccaceae bacterium]
MKELALSGVLPLLLAACTGPAGNLPAGLQERKPACAGGNFEVCANIGHEVRDAEGGPAPVHYPPFSQPIVD